MAEKKTDAVVKDDELDELLDSESLPNLREKLHHKSFFFL